MSLPTTGPLSLSQVNVELGLAATAQISLNDAAVRDLAGVASGAIGLQNLRGKASAFAFAIASNVQNANLRTLAINAGWNESSEVIATIASGVSVTSTSTGTPAMTVSGTFPKGVTLINNGTIAGRGGAGSGGQRRYASNSCTVSENTGGNGGAGGTGLSVSVPLFLDNKGTIGGGGGGGGSGRAYSIGGLPPGCPNPQFMYQAPGCGGGGAGFGAGGAHNRFRADSAAGSNCTSCCIGVGDQRSGFAGAAGSLTSGGARGARADTVTSQCIPSVDSAGNGGAGGSLGAAGANGTSRSGNGLGPTNGGAGGNAITGNNNITYIETGTRLGGITS